MLPVIDMLNHCGQNPNSTWKYNSYRQGVEVVATKAIKAGEEVLFYYGNVLGAEKFLINFGFYDQYQNTTVEFEFELSE